ncbi:MAG: hypothetical protein QF570_16225 [Myxococcota bacterium]|jgi:hypothetical protein|nr:hypothetical protein [Myxococcota bacterium]
MEFWSKGLGKKTIEMGLSKGESLLSEDSLCLRGIMEEPVSWEYVMLLDEADIRDFFALLQEPGLAKFVYQSPNRWSLYAGLVKGGFLIAWRALVAALSDADSRMPRVEIQVPPPSAVKKKAKKKKKVLYKRRLTTTTIEAPRMSPDARTADSTTFVRPAGV